VKLSGHEINSQLRQKLEMPTGRHLYGILGTYERLESYVRTIFPEARGHGGERLPGPINLNRALLERIPDNDLKDLVQAEARRPETIRKRLTDEIDALLAEMLEVKSFVALEQVELVFAYDLELSSLRIRAVNQKHILLLLPGERSGDRITLFHEASAASHRTLPANLIPENHLWELLG
jgi:hypothetical protein